MSRTMRFFLVALAWIGASMPVSQPHADESECMDVAVDELANLLEAGEITDVFGDVYRTRLPLGIAYFCGPSSTIAMSAVLAALTGLDVGFIFDRAEKYHLATKDEFKEVYARAAVAKGEGVAAGGGDEGGSSATPPPSPPSSEER